MSVTPSFRSILATLFFCSLSAYVSAESFVFDGQLTFHPEVNRLCAATMAARYHVVILVQTGGGSGIEGYLYGEQLLHASFRGNDPSALSLTYIGETSPQQQMRLRQLSPGTYSGQVQAISMLGSLYGCSFGVADITVRRVSAKDGASLDRAAAQFQLDNDALKWALQGLRGDPKPAIAAVQRALSAKQQAVGGSEPQMLPYYYFLAQLHLAEGSVPAAVALDREALGVCEQNEGADSACTGAMLVTLGQALTQNGQFDESEKDLRRALEICDKFFGPGSPLRGRALNSLSADLIYTGRYGEAETMLQDALTLNRNWPQRDNADVAVSLNNFGVLYQLTGQQRKSIDSLHQAVAMEENVLGTDHPLTLISDVMLADALRVAGDAQTAEPIARRALSTAQRVLGKERSDHPALALGQIGLAEIYRQTGKYQEAEALVREALANQIKYLGPDNPATAGSSLLLAKILHATGRDAEALALLRRANEVAHSANDQMLAWQVAAQLLAVYAEGPSANRVEAIYFGKQAVNDLQRLRGNLANSSAETQQAFVSSAEVSALYRRLASLLIADARPAEAQQILAMVKEQEFYEFTERKSQIDAPKTIAVLNPAERELDELDTKYVSLGNEYGALREKFRREGKLSTADHARLDTLRKAMDSAQTDFETSAAAFAKAAKDPEAQKRRSSEIDDFSRAFQGTLGELGHHAVIAQYIVLDDKVAILLATPEVIVVREAKVAKAELYTRIRALRRTLSNPISDPLPESQALYKLLVGPISDDLRQARAQTLMLDLDGMLRYVPFAALHDGSHYLVESLSVVMVTEAVRDKLSRLPKADWSVWGMGVTKGGQDYPPLPYANVELHDIAGKQGILPGKVMIDGEFTEQSLRDGLDQSYPVIHIASHFQFATGSMEDSFLLLGDGHHLTLAQIKTRLDLNHVELLTLSACETAVGDEGSVGSGAEIEGLGAIAQQSGARAVLATLWPVADASTAALMRTLYQAHKAEHLDKADALRHAQLALLHGQAAVQTSNEAERGLTRRADRVDFQTQTHFTVDPSAPYGHPFFWAPFILMGNWL